MKRKRIIMALIVTIMLVSAVACGTANKAEESKTTEEITKEVSSTVAPTEATTTATEATTQAVTEVPTKAKDNRRLINTLGLKFNEGFKLSEETLKNIKEYCEGTIWTNGECFDLSQIQYSADEQDCMEYFAFNMWRTIFIRDINSSNYLEPYYIDYNAKTQLEVKWDLERIYVRLYMIEN